MRRPVLFATLVLLGFAAGAAGADEPTARDGCQVDPSRRVDLPLRHLKVAAGIRLTEGPRGLPESFPYLAAAPAKVSGTGAWRVTPKNLGSILHEEPQKGGRVPAAVRTAEGAIEAVRLFAAGPVVGTNKAGARILSAAAGLRADLELLKVYVDDHRPKTWAPTATPLPQDRSIHPVEAWKVSLVALELDRATRLSHLEAVVKADGTVDLTRHVILSGPTAPQQWIFTEEVTDEEAERRERVWEAEHTLGRKRYVRALAPRLTPHFAWATARSAFTYADVVEVMGKAPRDVGSGIHIRAYDLADGTAVLFGEGGGKLIYARQAQSAPRVMRVGKILRTFAIGDSER